MTLRRMIPLDDYEYKRMQEAERRSALVQTDQSMYPSTLPVCPPGNQIPDRPNLAHEISQAQIRASRERVRLAKDGITLLPDLTNNGNGGGILGVICGADSAGWVTDLLWQYSRLNLDRDGALSLLDDAFFKAGIVTEAHYHEARKTILRPTNLERDEELKLEHHLGKYGPL